MIVCDNDSETLKYFQS